MIINELNAMNSEIETKYLLQVTVLYSYTSGVAIEFKKRKVDTLEKSK